MQPGYEHSNEAILKVNKADSYQYKMSSGVERGGMMLYPSVVVYLVSRGLALVALWRLDGPFSVTKGNSTLHSIGTPPKQTS
ncbi:hypothetical protein FKM82_001824 [Ascaphus truei]